MSDNNDGFIASIQTKPDASQQKPEASVRKASPQQRSDNTEGTDTGFVPSIHSTNRVGVRETEQPSAFEKADKTITDTLATNPENLKSFTRTNAIEVPKTLAREVYSGAKTVAGMVPGIYHAFADEVTPEEREQQAQFEKERGEAPRTDTSGLKRIGLGVERL